MLYFIGKSNKQICKRLKGSDKRKMVCQKKNNIYVKKKKKKRRQRRNTTLSNDKSGLEINFFSRLTL